MSICEDKIAVEVEQPLRNLTLVDKSSVELNNASHSNNDFLLKVCQDDSRSDGKIAVQCVSNRVRIFDPSTLVRTGTITGENPAIFKDVCFSKDGSSMLYVAPGNAAVRAYDLRLKLSKPSQYFKAELRDKLEHSKFLPKLELASVDASCSGMIAAGSSANKFTSPALFLWDSRMTETQRCLNEFHSDDIVQLTFSPDRAEDLLTGGDDSLINYIDLSESSEDDMLKSTRCIGDEIPSRIGWISRDEPYAVTSSERIQIWDCRKEDDETLLDTSVSNLPHHHQQIMEYSDVVDVFRDGGKRYILASQKTGDGVLYGVSTDHTCSPVHILSGGHKKTIRSCFWNPMSQTLYTVGEDSMVCGWSFSEHQVEAHTRTSAIATPIKPSKESRPTSKPYPRKKHKNNKTKSE